MGCNLFQCLRNLTVLFFFFLVKIPSQNFPCCSFCSLPATLSLYKEPGFALSTSWKVAETAARCLPSHSFLWTALDCPCFIRFLPAHFSRLLRSLRRAALSVNPSNLICKLANCAFCLMSVNPHRAPLHQRQACA